jgi:hypothetical protein
MSALSNTPRAGWVYRLGLVATLLVAGCAGPSPPSSGSASPNVETPDSSPSDSAPSSEIPTDPTELIECRRVPEDLCLRVAIGMMQGAQPDYALGATIERVLVTCEQLPPCGANRPNSGGKVIILYTNGWARSQDWAPGAGT